MKYSKFIFILLFSGFTYPTMPDMANKYTQWLKKMEEYQKGVRVVIITDTTKYHNFVEGYLDTTTFNLEKYMQFYSSLRVKPGYVVDYSNNYSPDGGYPRLFARKSELNLDSLLNKNIERDHHYWDSIFIVRLQLIEQDSSNQQKKERSIQRLNRIIKFSKLNKQTAKMSFARDSIYDAKYFLIPEDTPMGYFQLLIFHIIGDHFGLYWHSYYGYHFVIYETEHWDKLIRANQEENFSINFDEEKVKKLFIHHVTPQIKMENDRCLITLYTFYAMKGIYKTTWSISRTAPYEIKVITKEKLADNQVRGFY